MAYRPGPLKIVGWVLKSILYMVIVFIASLLIWRVYFSTKIPEKIRLTDVNDILVEAYKSNNGNITPYDQDQQSLTRGEDNYGYFSIEDYVIIPEAKQVQIIFRYNRSTLEHLMEDYCLAELPSRDRDWFDVTLVKTTDLTPDDKSDELDPDTLAKERYFPTKVIKESTKMYDFYRIVFDGVDIGTLDLGLFADIYYVGDIDYTADAYGTLCLYDSEMQRKDYEFDKDTVKKLKECLK